MVTSFSLDGFCINSLICCEGKLAEALEVNIELLLKLPIVSELVLALRPSEIRFGMLETSALKVGRLSMSLRLCVSMFVLMWLDSLGSAERRPILTFSNYFSADSGLGDSRICDSEVSVVI